jgi:hypothetical protein
MEALTRVCALKPFPQDTYLLVACPCKN